MVEIRAGGIVSTVTDEFIQELVASNAAAGFIASVRGEVQESERLIGWVRKLHNFVDASRMPFGVCVVMPLEGYDHSMNGPGDQRQTLRAATALHDPNLPNVYVVGVSSVTVHHAMPDRAPVEGVLMYFYEGPGREFFVSEDGVVICPAAAFGPTSFGGPFYEDLDDALSVYEQRMLKPMACHRLRQIWDDEELQLVLVNGPEHIMRDSLTQFLIGSLRQQENVLVLPEQNVDETHPVDIEVQWDGAKRLALIEIKWLGKSRHVTEPRVSTDYSASRAVSGLKQLADYIDAMNDRAGWASVVGYLAIFDARRRGGSTLTGPLSSTDALYYSSESIAFPTALIARHDLRTPLRWFMKPDDRAIAQVR